MTTFRHEQKPAPRIVRGAAWLTDHKFIISFLFNLLMLGMFLLGAVGMISFILEETLQAQGFGYAIPMMNQQWDDAYGAIKEEEPFIRANIKALRHTWNPITGRAFRAFASATARKLDRDIAFIQKQRKREKRQRYMAKIGR